MQRQKGFTLVELVLSMAFFSFIMLFVIVGFIHINRSYTRGLTVKEVQNVTRFVADSLTRSIRDANADSIRLETLTSDELRMCIGSTRYAWNMVDSGGNITNEQFLDASRPLSLAVTHDGAACQDGVHEHAGGTRTLVEGDLIVQYLDVSRIGSTSSFSVTVIISTDFRSHPDDFSGTGINAACAVKVGDQFCDVARIDTVVTARN